MKLRVRRLPRVKHLLARSCPRVPRTSNAADSTPGPSIARPDSSAIRRSGSLSPSRPRHTRASSGVCERGTPRRARTRSCSPTASRCLPSRWPSSTARWQIELFFKWIKQHLRIKRFFGTSASAVQTQLWIVILAYVLVAIVRKRLEIALNLYTLLQILSATFSRKPLSHKYLRDRTTLSTIPTFATSCGSSTSNRTLLITLPVWASPLRHCSFWPLGPDP